MSGTHRRNDGLVVVAVLMMLCCKLGNGAALLCHRRLHRTNKRSGTQAVAAINKMDGIRLTEQLMTH